jgi:hypothetical protein
MSISGLCSSAGSIVAMKSKTASPDDPEGCFTLGMNYKVFSVLHCYSLSTIQVWGYIFSKSNARSISSVVTLVPLFIAMFPVSDEYLATFFTLDHESISVSVLTLQVLLS